MIIGGFILGGDTGQASLLLRAIGPSLTTVGIANALANPTLELRDSNGVLLQSNDSWKDSQQAAIEGYGVPPQNDLDITDQMNCDPNGIRTRFTYFVILRESCRTLRQSAR